MLCQHAREALQFNEVLSYGPLRLYAHCKAQCVDKDASAAVRELYSGLAILRGLPVWALLVELVWLPEKPINKNNPKAGRRAGPLLAQILGGLLNPGPHYVIYKNILPFST